MPVVQIVIDDSTDKIITGQHTYDRDNGGIFIGGAGSSFPASPQEGEWFWRIDEAKLYRYNGSSWDAVVSSVGLHASTHEDGGSDEISVAGLSGVLADKQDADKIQGRDVNSGAPTDKQILQWNNTASEWELADLLWLLMTGHVKPATDGDAVRLYHSDSVQYAEIGRTGGNFYITVGGDDAQAAYLNCKKRQIQLGGSTTAEKWAVSNSGDGAIAEFYGDKTAKFFGEVTHADDVVPDSNNARDLGGTSSRWKNVYAQSGFIATSGGISSIKYNATGVVGQNTGVLINGGMSLSFKISQIFGAQAIAKFIGANATQRLTIRAYYGTGSGSTYVQMDHDGSDGVVASGVGSLLLDSADRIVAKKPFELPSYTVATLPSATQPGQMIYVSDETGGAVPAFSDGTNWRRVTDRAIVS